MTSSTARDAHPVADQRPADHAVDPGRFAERSVQHYGHGPQSSCSPIPASTSTTTWGSGRPLASRVSSRPTGRSKPRWITAARRTTTSNPGVINNAHLTNAALVTGAFNFFARAQANPTEVLTDGIASATATGGFISTLESYDFPVGRPNCLTCRPARSTSRPVAKFATSSSVPSPMRSARSTRSRARSAGTVRRPCTRSRPRVG